MAAFELAKQSWGVLTRHPKLAWFPVLAMVGALVALAIDAVFFVVVLLGDILIVGKTGNSETMEKGTAAAVVLVIVLATYLAAVVSSVCRAALIFETNKVLIDPQAEAGIGSGFSGAFRRLPALLGWSAIQAVVGSVVSLIQERAAWLGRLFDLAWNVVSFLALPFLVLEGKGPVESLKLSSATLKQRWGDNLKLNAGMAGIRALGLLAIALPAGGLAWAGAKMDWPVLTVSAVVVGLLCLSALALVVSTLTSILRTAFYRAIMDNRIPEAFAGERFQHMVYTR